VTQTDLRQSGIPNPNPNQNTLQRGIFCFWPWASSSATWEPVPTGRSVEL